MKPIALLYNPNNLSYRCKSNNYALDILGSFLVDDVDSWTDYWKKFILSSNRIGSSSNATWIDRIDNTVKIGLLVDLSEGIEDEDHTFTSTVDEICRILDQWDNLRKQKPNYIIISREPDGVFLTGYDEMPDEYKQYLQEHHRV